VCVCVCLEIIDKGLMGDINGMIWCVFVKERECVCLGVYACV